MGFFNIIKAENVASYPYLIQSMYRAGYFTHYAGEGSIKSCKISYKGEEVDLCLCRTKARFSQNGKDRILSLDPVEIEFSGLTIKLVSTFTFTENTGEIKISRKIVKSSNPEEKVTINEYITACYGTTEYPEDMTGIRYLCKSENATKSINYRYRCREESIENAVLVQAMVPQVNTRVSMLPINREMSGYIREGYAFSPMFTLGLTTELSKDEEMITCLRLEKAN